MSTTRRMFQLLVIPATAGLLALAGCGNGAPAANANGGTTAALDPAADKGHHGAHHGPFVPLLGEASHLKDLTADQTAKLDVIRDTLKTKGEAQREAGKQLGELLAKSLDAGKLDQTAIDAKLAELDQLAAAEKTATDDALNQLHALLTPAQRATLVANVDSHFGKHDGKKHDGAKGGFGGPGGPGGKMGPPPGGPGMHGPGGPMGKVLDDLQLTPAQKTALDAKLAPPAPPNGPPPDFAEMKAKIKAMHEAFVKDAFDAKAFAVGMPSPSMGRMFGDHMVKFVAAAIDVLDPTQRAKLAADMRDHSAKMK